MELTGDAILRFVVGYGALNHQIALLATDKKFTLPPTLLTHSLFPPAHGVGDRNSSVSKNGIYLVFICCLMYDSKKIRSSNSH